MSSPNFLDSGDSSKEHSPRGPLGYSTVINPTGAGRGNENLTPATHANMLSSRRWPADEPRPANTASTPTKRAESARIDASGRSEVLGLDMSDSGIKTLTPCICRFTFLTELRLGNNYLTRLPPGIGQLKALAFLDLSNNQIADLPPEVGWLSNLKELLLFNNHLQDLPGELGYLYQLENFGIEGNPINEGLMQVIHSQGPLGLIPFLRDHVICILKEPFSANCLAIDPPADRIWQNLETYSQGPSKGIKVLELPFSCVGNLSVVCYNVLCDKYATPQMFGYVPSWYLSWDYRKQLILHEILSFDADIVCLQEVESSQFDQYFKPQLRMRGGYDGIFSPKSRAKTMAEWDRAFVDGCATFFKADKYV